MGKPLQTIVEQQGFLSRDELVATHMGLVKKVAYRILKRLPDSVDVEDLISAGMVGLLQATDKYDPVRGPFADFAEWRIKGAIIDELRGIDHLTRSQRDKVSDEEELVRSLEQELQRPVDSEDLAREQGISREALRRLRKSAANYQIISLEVAPSNERNGPEDTRSSVDLNNFLIDPWALLDEDRMVLFLSSPDFNNFFDRLPEREQKLFEWYHTYEELTLDNLGKIMGITESRVCQILRQIAKNFQRYLVLGENLFDPLLRNNPIQYCAKGLAQRIKEHYDPDTGKIYLPYRTKSGGLHVSCTSVIRNQPFFEEWYPGKLVSTSNRKSRALKVKYGYKGKKGVMETRHSFVSQPRSSGFLAHDVLCFYLGQQVWNRLRIPSFEAVAGAFGISRDAAEFLDAAGFFYEYNKPRGSMVAKKFAEAYQVAFERVRLENSKA